MEREARHFAALAEKNCRPLGVVKSQPVEIVNVKLPENS